VDSIDPIAVGTPLVLMLGAGVCAGLIPSIRASHIDPAKALRQE
jgi:ABC-type antimicrobial peptide transport system permease subunit